MKKKNKDPLKPKEDVRIDNKENGFLETLKKVVGQKSNQPKITFDFSQFPNFDFSDQLNSIPDEIRDKYSVISEYLLRVLESKDVIHIIYPPNNEIELKNQSNIDAEKFNKISTAIYNYVVYDNPLI